jgi:hypothetical protein
MGDLNSYAMEDPISIIKNAGYTDLIQSYVGGGGYSYNFNGETGYLDHMLASPSLVSQVTGVTEWHINADEPSALDYNDYNQPALYNPGPYRSSDHDPAIIGLCTDTTKPDLTVTVTPDTLWPANHKYVDVSVNVQITDADPNVTLELVSVVSTEPDNGLGDGDQSNDIVILDNFNFQVRAERSGTGGGRLYLITYRATDACGNTSTTTAIVFVPHDNSK